LPAQTSLRRAHEILDYVTMAEERYREVQTYSTGMRQKIKLAQALIHAPKLLFLDEPTNGLDPTGRDKMLRIVRNLSQKKGVSVVISTHILSDVEECCDSALILGRGKLLVYDTLARLRESVDPTCRVRVDGDPDPLCAALKARGCVCWLSGKDEIQVAGVADIGELVFAAARLSNTVLREVAPSRNTLEDSFMKAMRDTGDPSPAAGNGSGA